MGSKSYGDLLLTDEFCQFCYCYTALGWTRKVKLHVAIWNVQEASFSAIAIAMCLSSPCRYSGRSFCLVCKTELQRWIALLLVAQFLEDLAKGVFLMSIILNVVFHITSWRLSVNIANQGLQICKVREFSSLNSRPYLQPRLADTSFWET